MTKKNILVICDRIEDSATGKITYYIAKELSQSYNIYLVFLTSQCCKIEDENIKIYPILDRYGKYKSLIQKYEKSNKLLKIFGKLFYKLYYIFNKKRLFEVKDHKNFIYKICEDIIKKYNINIIISASNPFEIQRIAYKLKCKYDFIDWYPYLFDSVRNNINTVSSIEEEREIFTKAKKIFAMYFLKNDTSFYNDFKEKIIEVFFPILPIKLPKSNLHKEKIILTYAGMFYDEIRNPENLLKLFTFLPENYVLRLHTRGCREIIESYKNKLGEKLEIKSFVKQDELLKSITNSNIMINIGNISINQAPSKAIEMLAYGKPIINFYQNQEDLTIKYMDKYPNALNIDYNNFTNKDITNLQNWCEKNKDQILSYDNVIESFKDISLKSLSNKIIDIIGNNL